MRIIAGSLRGRKLAAPDDLVARPTSDRAREALFNILGSSTKVDLVGASVLDGFAGTGALGLEALSRGADRVTFMENHPQSLKALNENIRALKLGSEVDVIRADMTKPPRALQPVDLVLLDAPYNMDLSAPALLALDGAGWIKPSTLVVIEVAAKEAFTAPDGFVIHSERTYGAAKFLFIGKA